MYSGLVHNNKKNLCEILTSSSGDRGDRGGAGGFYSGSGTAGGPGGAYVGNKDDAGRYKPDNAGSFK